MSEDSESESDESESGSGNYIYVKYSHTNLYLCSYRSRSRPSEYRRKRVAGKKYIYRIYLITSSFNILYALIVWSRRFHATRRRGYVVTNYLRVNSLYLWSDVGPKSIVEPYYGEVASIITQYVGRFGVETTFTSCGMPRLRMYANI